MKLLPFLAAALCVCAVSSCDIFMETRPKNPEDSGKTDSEEIDWSDPDWYATNFWERTDRQKAGIRGPVKKWHISNYTTYDEYEYDEAGHLVKKAYVNTDNSSLNHEWRYTYDSAGNRIKEEYIGSPEELGDYTVYEYENEGKFVATDGFMMGPAVTGLEDELIKGLSRKVRAIEQPFSTLYQETLYTFGEDGNLTVTETDYEIYESSEERENEESRSYTVVYENGYPKSFDSEAYRFKVLNVTYYPNGMYKDFEYLEENSYNFDTGWDRHTYKMLDNPRYLEVESFDLEGTASYMTLTPKWTRITYDEHFDIVRNEESYGSDDYVEGAEPTFVDTWTEYTYDKYGNWTTRLESVVPRYTGGLSETTVRREMEYFD